MVVDEVTLVNVLRWVCLVIDSLGIIVGLDLIIGAPLITFLSKLLNRVIDFDKSLAKAKIRISLGLLFVAIAAIMMYVTLKSG